MLILYALGAALASYVYCQILTDAGMVLNWWYNFLEDVLINKRKRPLYWLFKPLIGCMRCVAGQSGLWCYFLYINQQGASYSLLNHVIFISFAIYIIEAIHKLYTWTQQPI